PTAPADRGALAAALPDRAPDPGGGYPGCGHLWFVRLAHGAGCHSGGSPDCGPEYGGLFRDLLCIQRPGPVHLGLAPGLVYQLSGPVCLWALGSVTDGDHLLVAHADVVWDSPLGTG